MSEYFLSDLFLIIAGFALVLCSVSLVIFIIQAISKKPKKKIGFIIIALFIIFVVFELIGISIMCDHNYIVVSEDQATCTEDGTRQLRCDICEKEKTEKISELGHNMVEINRIDASCTANGEIQYCCDLCGMKSTEDLSALEHNMEKISEKDATCESDGEIIYRCALCGTENAEKFSALGHDMKEISRTSPTAASEGDILYKCSRCGKEEVTIIPKVETTQKVTEATTQRETEEVTQKAMESQTPAVVDTKVSTADISQIEVSYKANYIDEDRLHLTVYTRNNSDEIFVGDIYVAFYSADGKRLLGSDTIIVDELLPGRESWANVVVDAYKGVPKLFVDFWGPTFTPVEEITVDIDQDATNKTKDHYYAAYTGVSWYNDITDIRVYSDGVCVVSVNTKPKNDGQFYAAVIWGCGNDYGVESVRVEDPEGKILSIYESP